MNNPDIDATLIAERVVDQLEMDVAENYEVTTRDDEPWPVLQITWRHGHREVTFQTQTPAFGTLFIRRREHFSTEVQSCQASRWLDMLRVALRWLEQG